jgi:site-specific DNA recombinase
MRAVIYARYSTELQRESSIDDQIRLCKAKIAAEGWVLAASFSDAAQSGASRLRPGYQRMLMEARTGAFDVIVAESLDRLSRDQEDVAALFKQLSFAGVRLVTLGEGEINELHVGLKGTMNALFLKDLAQKVRRGLEGRVRQGRSGGGLCYGYDVTIEHDVRGERVHGGRKVNEAQAAVVRRIFSEFAEGTSPRAIAVALNAERIPGPHGKPWGMSTIYGNWRRGTGILNNELYAGRLVWNRQRFVKDPSTGKRQAKPNPKALWIIEDVPELRIVEPDLWQQVKERQRAIRGQVLSDNHRVRSERARRPAYLLSGLLHCGGCGGGFSKVSAQHYGCSNARNRGTCSNMMSIRRDVIEATVLSGLKTHLMHPDLVKEFVAEYHRELNRRNAVQESDRELREAELARIERQIRSIIEAIKDGMRTSAMRDELMALEARKEELARMLRQAPAPVPRLHPNLAEIYRQKVARLQEELNRQELRAEAGEILRSLISEVRLVPENGRLEVELAGDLAGILALTSGSKKPVAAGDGLQVTLVAGVGFEPTTFRL